MSNFKKGDRVKYSFIAEGSDINLYPDAIGTIQSPTYINSIFENVLWDEDLHKTQIGNLLFEEELELVSSI